MFSRIDMERFFERLEGSEGCDFKEEVPGDVSSITWKCTCGGDKSLSLRILKLMGVSIKDSDEFLNACDKLGGYCDCRICLLTKEKMLEGGK